MILHVCFYVCKFWDNARGGLFSATKTFAEKYKKLSTPGPAPKQSLEFSYIRIWYICELLWNRIEKQSDHTSNDKVRLFRENIVVIEEEWFVDMNLTDGATFLAALIKSSKSRINQKINFHVAQSDAYGKLK